MLSDFAARTKDFERLEAREAEAEAATHPYLPDALRTFGSGFKLQKTCQGILSSVNSDEQLLWATIARSQDHFLYTAPQLMWFSLCQSGLATGGFNWRALDQEAEAPFTGSVWA